MSLWSNIQINIFPSVILLKGIIVLYQNILLRDLKTSLVPDLYIQMLN